MKKIFFAFVAVAAMVACNKNNDVVSSQQPAGEPGVITFDVKELVATKAVSESTDATVQATGFNIAGLAGGVEYFNELATYGSGSYATAKKYYYPSGKTMDFYAVHPINNKVTLTGAVATVDYSHSKYEDLIVAKRNDVAAQTGDVALTFDHVLSQLLFTAQGSDANATYKLNSIVVNAPNGGTYKFADNSWTRGELANETYWNTKIDVATDAKTAIEESMTFVPGEIVVTVNWDTYVDGELIANYEKSTTAGALSLEQGKQNTVNLTLPNASAQGISFTVSVNPWGKAEDQNVTLD